MKTALFAVIAVVLALPGAAQEPGKKDKKTHPGFERLKKLVGAWQSETAEMGKVTVTYRLIAGGSTVMETIMPGTDHEMVTMYHLDGEDLVLTHYCVIGNQPRMKAEKQAKDDVLDFRCVTGGSVKCATDMHMHSALFTFKDADHFTAEWSMMKDGKVDHSMKFDYERQKKESAK
jgi:hypothetical protein